MKAIEVLDPRVQACIRKRGFTVLSDAQKEAIPHILRGDHTLLIAPTGTGKTESAMFPVFNALLTMPAGGGFQGIVHHPPAFPEPRYPFPDAVVVQRTRPDRGGPPRGYAHGRAAEAGALIPRTSSSLRPRRCRRSSWANGSVSTLPMCGFVIIDEIHELAGSKRGAQLGGCP